MWQPGLIWPMLCTPAQLTESEDTHFRCSARKLRALTCAVGLAASSICRLVNNLP
jgi:hypothetical protein